MAGSEIPTASSEIRRLALRPGSSSSGHAATVASPNQLNCHRRRLLNILHEALDRAAEQVAGRRRASVSAPPACRSGSQNRALLSLLRTARQVAIRQTIGAVAPGSSAP